MVRKFSVLMAATAVLAFAAPALASASTGLTENGALLAVGAKVTGTNVGNVTVTSAKFGNIICEEMMLEGSVAKNGVGGVEVGAGGVSNAGRCSLNGVAVLATNVAFTNLTSTAAEVGTGKASFSWEIDLPLGLTCKFSAVGSPLTYVANGDVIKFAKAALAVAPAACGVATLDAEFTLSTPNNVKLEIM